MSALFAGIVTSCNNNDEERDDTVKEVFSKKIDSIRIPMDTMQVGEIQQFRTYSQFSKNCEGLFDVNYIYEKDLSRTVVNYAYKINRNCSNENYTSFGIVNFQPKEKGIYNFKFYSGKDSNNVNTFIEKKVVVE